MTGNETLHEAYCVAFRVEDGWFDIHAEQERANIQGPTRELGPKTSPSNRHWDEIQDIAGQCPPQLVRREQKLETVERPTCYLFS